jgi:protocatechuate 3,4-dioxygenase beta subunit
MKTLIITPFFVIASTCFLQCNGQPEKTDALLKEAQTEFENGTGVSEILSGEKYQAIRPQTEFRELVKKFADTNVLKIDPPSEKGKKIRVLVLLKDATGAPVSNALVYLYQTDARGWYSASSPHVGGNAGDMMRARLFGYVRTNQLGGFELHTVKPAGYPQSNLPAHIHIHIESPGKREYVTELLFDDDERLAGEIRIQSEQNRFFIAIPEEAPSGFDQQFSYTIRMN